ncbi:S9 family peptidase [Rheinheimera sp. 4Y26]|uniref:S9 family peptidase n=1 Tax=Rheinheimera sp. 4Y26 TaxID=2977811 RepID=UPI0021B13F50|nr:S9 family peptidase [Rheinheimera sp. 4Y26]MCT6699524.1 S9 family peptidase [Rheinheimera sp. 4Y26]
MNPSLTTGLTLVAAATFSVAVNAKQLELKALFADPALSGQAPKSLSYSPDGSRVTYLKGKTTDANRLDLWQYQLKSRKHSLLVDSYTLFSGPEELSDEEKARRERLRLFASGIVSYSWSKDGKALLFPLNGDLYYYDLAKNKARKLTDTKEFETDAQISPKGRYVSFVREQNIYVLDLISGKEQQLTTDGKGTIKNGMAEFVAQEEMARMTGYWWAPDDSKIAFTQFDDAAVPEVLRNEIYANEIKLYNQRYPYAGANNVSIKLGVVALSSAAVQWLDLGEEKDFYLPRVQWTQNPNQLTYQWQSRDQQKLELRMVDLTSAQQQILLTEQNNTWLNLHDDLYFFKDKKRFIWASERDGFKHLYLYQFDGKAPLQLTSGQWVVNKIESVDEKNGVLYFTGRKDTVLENHLYRLNLNNQHIARLTTPGASHAVVVAKDGSGFLDSYSAVNSLPKVQLNDNTGKTLTVLEANELNADHPLTPYWPELVQPRFGTLTAKDGQTLHYRVFEPKNLDHGKKHPVIVSVYGGPGAQRVTNSWSGKDLYFHYMAQRGYIVFQLDNRGSENRGKNFEDPIYKQLGVVEVEDQITGVEYLRTLPYVDSSRIGVYGHSYGGYMAIMAMFKAGDYFAAGVSGAPVTDWTLYDTHYTERYLGHPAQNAQGYLASSVFPYSDALKGDLLIYHGMADDNVLFSNSTKLFSDLQNKGKNFDMMTYPGSKHAMFGQQVQTHLHQTITNFFDRTLLNRGK